MKNDFLDDLTANPDHADTPENAPKDGVKIFRGIAIGPTLTRAELEEQFGGPQPLKLIKFTGPNILGEIEDTWI
jgi:hypothetical protein